MTATFDPTLATDRDFVRQAIGDTDTSEAQLTDEAIDAFLSEESNKYRAAAMGLEFLLNSWIADGKGVVEKQVENLRIKRLINLSSVPAVRAQIDWLRRRGNYKLMQSSKVFRVTKL